MKDIHHVFFKTLNPKITIQTFRLIHHSNSREVLKLKVFLSCLIKTPNIPYHKIII